MLIRTTSFMLLFLPATLVAADWPQFLGPTRDGHSPETGLKRDWPKAGPAKLWDADVGTGYSGPVVVGGKVLLHDRVDNDEILHCRDAANGKEIWKWSAPTTYVDAFGFDDGPRATPSVFEGHVFTFGAEGRLACVALDSGKVVWQRELGKEFTIKKSFFGVGSSPLVSNDGVFVNVGAKNAGVVGFDRKTGKTLWQVNDDEASYSSPILAKLDGKDRLVFLTRKGLLVLDPADGKVERDQYFRSRNPNSANAASPLVAGEQIFLTASYETGALLLDAKNNWKEIWKNDESLSCHYNTPVKLGEFLYGIHGRQEYGAELRCVEWATGKVRWSKAGFGCAFLIAADGLLIAAVETGEVVLIEPSDKEYREKGRFAALEKPGVNRRSNAVSVALSDGRLFVRDARKLAGFDVKK